MAVTRDPLAMPSALLRAHADVDAEVDRLGAVTRRISTIAAFSSR
jgi:hypothetical protein